MRILHWTKNWSDVLLVHEGFAIVIQMFVEVPLKHKSMILCNTFIVKTILYFIVKTLRMFIYAYEGIAITRLLCNTFGTRQHIPSTLSLNLIQP
jgi:hypothetical protein